jgi:hypothetical protein
MGPAPHGVSLGGSTVAPGRTYVAPGTGTARTSRREAASPKRSAAVRRPGGTRSRPPRGDVQRGAALGDNRRSGNGTLGAMHGAQPTPRARRRSTRPGNDERRPVCIGGGGFQAPDRKWAAFVKCGPAATAHRRPYPVTAAATSPRPSPRARPAPERPAATRRSRRRASPLRRPPKQIRTSRPIAGTGRVDQPRILGRRIPRSARRTRRQHGVGLRVRPTHRRRVLRPLCVTQRRAYAFAFRLDRRSGRATHNGRHGDRNPRRPPPQPNPPRRHLTRRPRHPRPRRIPNQSARLHPNLRRRSISRRPLRSRQPHRHPPTTLQTSHVGHPPRGRHHKQERQ